MIFCEKLDFLMKCINIKNSELAKYLFVDSSLVSRWRNGKRKLRKDNVYFDKICEFFDGKDISSHQKDRIIKFMKKDDYIVRGEKNYITKWLYKSENENECREEYKVEDKCTKILNSIMSEKTEKDYIDYSVFDVDYEIETPIIEGKFYKGSNELKKCCIDILKDIDGLNSPSSIKFISNKPLDDSLKNNKFKHELMNAVAQLGERGHTFQLINNYKISEGKLDSFFFECIKYARTKNFECYNGMLGRDNATVSYMVIIPGVRVVFIYADYEGTYETIAMAMNKKSVISMLESKVNENIKNSKSILQIYEDSENDELKKCLVSIYNNVGTIWKYSSALTGFTMPKETYANILRRNSKNEKYINEEIEYNALVYNNIKKNLDKYEYKCLMPLRCLDEMIVSNDYKYTNSEFYSNIEIKANYKDIKEHLENTIKLLEEYDNFYIALVDSDNMEYFEIPEDMMIRCNENHRLFISNEKSGGLTVRISDFESVKSIEQCLEEMWNSTPKMLKDKKNIIELINKKIEILNKLIDKQ